MNHLMPIALLIYIPVDLLVIRKIASKQDRWLLWSVVMLFFGLFCLLLDRPLATLASFVSSFCGFVMFDDERRKSHEQKDE